MIINYIKFKLITSSNSALALNVISKYVNAYRCKVRAKLLAPLSTNATASELVMSADGSLFILIIISRTRIPSLSAIEPGTICMIIIYMHTLLIHSYTACIRSKDNTLLFIFTSEITSIEFWSLPPEI